MKQEEYPGQKFFHATNANVKATENRFNELKHIRFGWFVAPEEVGKLSFLEFLKHQRFGLIAGIGLGCAIATIVCAWAAK